MALRWYWLVILLVVATAATSYVVSRMLPPVYEATSVIMVGQSIQAPDLSTQDILTSERLARTYADIAQRQPVLQEVIETLALSDTWQDFKKRVQVQPVRDTQLLEITVEANSPKEAQLTADELTHQLILLSPAALQREEDREKQALVNQRLENLQVRIETGLERLAALEGEMANTQSVQRLQELQGEINALERLITDWEANHTQLLTLSESKKSPNYLAVIQPAQADPDPVHPRPLLNTFVAGVAGLILAVGVIYLLEYLDDTLKTVDDLSQTLNVTPLGAISHFRSDGSQDWMIAPQDTFSGVSESFRMIRSNIQFAAIDRAVKTLLVTSPSPGEGKSTIVANLGVVMAQAGLKTIIVDCDLRRPVQHRVFGLVNLGGLADVLTSPDLEIKNYLRDPGFENLQVMSSGFLPPNPSELLGSERMKQLLTDLTEMADVVIFDSPPALGFADAVVLSNRVDGVVLVTNAGQTRCGMAQQAVSNLQQAGANLLGAVLNRVPLQREGYYYQRYYSGRDGHGSAVEPVQTRREGRWTWLPIFRFSNNDRRHRHHEPMISPEDSELLYETQAD
jgi:capsular exopolysaccharide synthesis family protein